MANIDEIRDGFRRCVESVEREVSCYEKSIALRDEEIKRLRAENDRMRPVFDLARRWCNRPLSVLRAGATVFANDAELFAELHQRVAAAKETP